MTDSTWDDYAAEDVVTEAVADIAPVLDAATIDAGQAEDAGSWADWHEDTAVEAAEDAAAEVDYANEMYASGFDGAGDAALARADISSDRAENEDAMAGDYFDTADSEATSAVDGYATATDWAADAVDTAASYDTTSYDTTSYDTAADTTSYDTSYDAGVADTGYDADDAV